MIEDYIADVATMLSENGREDEAFDLTELASKDLEDAYYKAMKLLGKMRIEQNT